MFRAKIEKSWKWKVKSKSDEDYAGFYPSLHKVGEIIVTKKVAATGWAVQKC